MQPTGKKVEFERMFPLLGVTEDGIAVSRKGAITLGWELQLPVLYTKSEDEYDGMIHAMDAAFRILPPWYTVLRQDIYTFEKWQPVDSYGKPALSDAPKSFFKDAFERHFTGREYLVHRAYIFITMSSFGMLMKNGRTSGLFGIKSSAVAPSRKEFDLFLAKSKEFEAILTSGSGLSVKRLSFTDWVGTEEKPGIVHRYMYLGESSGQISEWSVTKESISCFHKKAQAFSIYTAEKLPPVAASVRRNNLLSLETNPVIFSLGSAIGTQLNCEHIVNTLFVIPDQSVEKARLINEQKKMKAGSEDDENALSASEIQLYKEKLIKESPFTIKANITLIAWDDEEKFDEITSLVSSAFSNLGAMSCYVKYNMPLLWYAGIPGNATEIGVENLMTMELSSALCLNNWDTFQKDVPGGKLRICDRTRHIPIWIDTQSVAQELGYIFDLNAFILGPSGTGKSFFMNYYLRNCYDSGESVFNIDVGGSYEGLCTVIHEESEGRDGQYYSWDADHPLTFNPFIGCTDWLDANGNVKADSSGANFVLSILKTLWAPVNGWASDSEPILKQTLTDFVRDVCPGIFAGGHNPVFNDYYVFLRDVLAPRIINSQYKVMDNVVRADEFDINKFLRALSFYSLKGVYGTLLNDENPASLMTSRFAVFEVSALSQVKDEKYYSICILCIINMFDRKMRERIEEFDVMVIEEAWKAISNETMAPYLRELWKTARKYNTSAVVVTQSMEDIVASDVIKDAIIENSSTKILLDQSNARNNFSPIADALSLNSGDIMKIFSMNLGKDPRYHYRDVFIKLGEGFSGVFSTEVSYEEALAYESAHDKKAPLLRKARQLGSLRKAIEAFAAEKR